jgi:hypothetical protein
MPHFKPPGNCPVCHEHVPRKALACPSCGACGRSGWNLGDAVYDGVDLPNESFDYDAFLAQEFGGKRAVKQSAKQWWWWIALLMFLVMLWGFVAQMLRA